MIQRYSLSRPNPFSPLLPLSTFGPHLQYTRLVFLFFLANCVVYKVSSKGHFTHTTESPWPFHFKHSHWWKRRSRSKFKLHTTLEGPTEYKSECKMDGKSTWTTTSHQMEHVSWSLPLFSNHLLKTDSTLNQETMALRTLITIDLFIISCVKTHMNKNSLK